MKAKRAFLIAIVVVLVDCNNSEISSNRISNTESVTGVGTDAPPTFPPADTNYTGNCDTLAKVVGLPPGHWCVVPNSHARSVEKKPNEWDDWDGTSSAKYVAYQGGTGFSAIMKSWGGAAFDSLRDRLLVSGGGHSDYGGNELLAFSLWNLQWSRITDPSSPPGDLTNGDFQNPDGTPLSRHTVWGIHYIEHADRLMIFGGGGFYNGYATPGTWTFDLAAAATNNNPATNAQYWQLMNPVNQPSPQSQDVGAYDPVTGLVLQYHQESAGRMLAYDYNNNKWLTLASTGWGYIYRYAVVDPVHHKFLVFHAVDDQYQNVELRSWTIPGSVPTSDVNLAWTDLTTDGDATMDTANSAGIVWDNVAQKVIAYRGDSTVYAYDVDSNTWTAYPSASTNAANPGPITASGGIFGRFRYSNRMNIYVYVDSVDSDVYLYRFAPTPEVQQ